MHIVQDKEPKLLLQLQSAVAHSTPSLEANAYYVNRQTGSLRSHTPTKATFVTSLPYVLRQNYLQSDWAL